MDDTENISSNEIRNSTDEHKSWFQRYWYLCAFPAFVCGFGTQCLSVLPPIVLAIICASVLGWTANQFDHHSRRGIVFIFVAPIVFFVLLWLGCALFWYSSPIFHWADIYNPYLDRDQKFMRAMLKGAVSVFPVVVGMGLTKMLTAKR